MGGLPRRFLNLILDNRINGVRSLRCIDITRQNFFNTTKPAQSPDGKGSESEEGPQEDAETAAVAGGQKNKQAAGGDEDNALKMERIWLPSPSLSIRGSTSSGVVSGQPMHFFPVADRRVVCVDHSGCSLLLEADTGNVVIMPRLHKPKLMPISLSVPSPDSDGTTRNHLFVMERILKPEPSSMEHEQTCQFEAFVYRKPTSTYVSKSWQCQLLPSLPYLHDTNNSFPHITSYAVVNDGAEICISVNGVGTFCLNTTSYTWSEVGKWMLPFYGKVEYVPELKLWFGVSATDHNTLAAADLSAMDTQPQLLGTWKHELDDLPEEWKECKDSQLVNLGSGKLCIARFFHAVTPEGDTAGDESMDQNSLAVLTGVEVALHARHDSNANANVGSGGVKLKFSNHRSRCYKSNSSYGTIAAVF